MFSSFVDTVEVADPIQMSSWGWVREGATAVR